MLARLPQRVLRLGHATAEPASPGECPITHADSSTPYCPRRRRGEPTDLGGSPLRRGALWPSPRGAADASGRVAGRAAATAVAHEAHGSLSCRHAESSEPGLSGDGSQHQMGDRYHLHSNRRALALSLCRTGFVFGPGGGLVNEFTTGPSVGGPGGADGLMATTGPDAGHPPFGSGLSIHLGGVPTVLGGAPGHL